MPSQIEGEARQAVKRAIPKSSNKIHAAGVARLYIAYPDRSRWTYTGLQGAIVICNDLVGNTFWLKMVDISPAGRGVIWDQEIYDSFAYNQDRIFFHTFELEECQAGLSFVDDKEAKQFKKKVDEREKNAHRNTKAKAFANSAGNVDESSLANGKPHSRLGGLGRNLLHGHIHSSPTSNTASQSIIPSRDVSVTSSPQTHNARQKDAALENVDPALLAELKQLGLSEDQLQENADFIRMYVEQRQAETQAEPTNRRVKAPPPPTQPLTPQDTGNTSSSRRGPPPAPPPARGASNASRSESIRPPSPPSETEPSPSRPAFNVPPPIADAGKFANTPDSPSAATRRRAGSNVQCTPGPPPPPRPPKTPIEEDKSSHVFGVPPPFTGERKPVPPPSRSSAPPPPPARKAVGSGVSSTAPPPPPPRDTSGMFAVPPANAAPPPLPPKTPNSPPRADAGRSVPPPPPPPGRDTARAVPPPPPMPPRDNAAPPPPPMPSRNNAAPPPPPLPSGGAPPPPPPPPPPGAGAPPAPPLPPGMAPATANAPALPKGGDGRDGLMADIRGGARLKKVSDSEKRDRSGAQVPGGADGASGSGSGGAAAPPAGEAGGLAGALANALAARKAKVSTSDDEDDKDDW